MEELDKQVEQDIKNEKETQNKLEKESGAKE